MKTRFYFLIAVTLLFTACDNKPDCFKGTGPLTAEERMMGTVTHIELLCNADVIIHPDTIRRLRVTAGANLIDKIETEMDGHTLRIRNNNRCNWVRSFKPNIKVEIWTNEVVSIRCDESTGNVYFADTLTIREFRFDSYSSLGTYQLKLKSDIITLALHNGPADFYGEGDVDVCYYYSSGFGKLDFRNIRSNKIYMTNKGTNDMFVYATELIEARLEESGNIYYRGDPPVLQTTITGSGVMRPLQ